MARLLEPFRYCFWVLILVLVLGPGPRGSGGERGLGVGWPGSNLKLDLHLPVTGRCKSQLKICLGAFWTEKPMVTPLCLPRRRNPPSPEGIIYVAEGEPLRGPMQAMQ